ncbi:MAG: TonB-dependent receptor [Hyphomonadaceae bacterium]|nr:TonB-dependent receptor [Hyphomonadaceae bacterium]
MARKEVSNARVGLFGISLAAFAAATAAGAAPALGQEASEAQETEIVVTGFRNSLAAAIDLKRAATGAVDAIVAEDIADFPDLNLSEAIQRIPGVALARDAGEGRQISVRGLGPQFTRVRINGMEALSTAGGTDAAGGTNRGRAFDFNVFAADLFNNITVRKTASAETEEGSLGATVDLRTGRPFDYDGFTFALNGQASYNDLSEETSPRGAGLISQRWDTPAGQFGALLSVAYTKRKLIEEGVSTVRWATGNAFAPGFDAVNNAQGLPTTANPAAAAVNAAYHPRIPRFDLYTQEQERLGATLALQWRPTDRTEMNFDVLYARFSGTREEQFLEVPSFSTGGACTAATLPNTCGIADTNVLNPVIENNTLIAATFNDIDLRAEDRFDELETTFTQYSFDITQDITSRLRAHILLGTSESEHDNPVQTTLLFDQFNVDGYAYDYRTRVPLITYGNADLTSPTAWRLTQIRLRPQNAVNTYETMQGNLHFEAADWLNVSGGVDWKHYTFETSELRRSNGTTANQEAVIPANVAAAAVSSYSSLLNFSGKGLGMPAGNATAWLVPDIQAAAALFSLYDTNVFRMGPEPSLNNNRAVEETDVGAWVQADWDLDIAGRPFRGNIGVRKVETSQEVTGVSFISGAARTIVVSRDYDDTLPALNMVYEPLDNFLIRLGAAKTMSRPDLGNLTPGVTVNTAGNSRTVTAGNPNLDPFRANAYDLSFEWYPAEGAILSLALFRKDIQSFVQTLTSQSTFGNNPFGLPNSVVEAACGIGTANPVSNCDATNTQWTFTAPVNTDGGKVEGWEVNYQQRLDFLPGLLSNLGLLLNYTYVKSEQDYVNAAGAVVATNDINGLSRNAYNATVYYEDDRISARVSAAYRDKYLTRVPGQEAGTAFDGTNDTFNVDASFAYTLNDNWKLTFEGINLTDEFQDQFNDAANRVSFYHHSGREFLFGFRFSH